MNKWRWLLLVVFCWIGGGFVFFDNEQQSFSERLLPREPARIVSLAPSLTEILFALGLNEEIVGVTVFSDYPAAAGKKPKVGSFRQPNIEAIIAARADLVVTLGFDLQRALAGRLRRIGCNTLTVDIDKVDELFGAIKIIGAATAREPQAEELVCGLKSKLAELSDLVGAEKKIKVLWVVQRKPLRVAGRNTFVNEMIELAGGENAIGPTVHKYPPIGKEQIYAGGPDVIIEPAMTKKNIAAQQAAALKYWSRFKNIPAVKNKRIFVIDGDTVSRLGPRLYEGIETIARRLRPEVFKN